MEDNKIYQVSDLNVTKPIAYKIFKSIFLPYSRTKKCRRKIEIPIY